MFRAALELEKSTRLCGAAPQPHGGAIAAPTNYGLHGLSTILNQGCNSCICIILGSQITAMQFDAGEL
jgi:hypothetical protein